MHLVKKDKPLLLILLLLSTLSLASKKDDAPIKTNDTLVFPYAFINANTVTMADNGIAKRTLLSLKNLKGKSITAFYKHPKRFLKLSYATQGAANNHFLNDRFRIVSTSLKNNDEGLSKIYRQANNIRYRRLFIYAYFKNLASLGIYYAAKGELQKAFTYIQKAHKVAHQKNLNSQAIRAANNNLAVLHHALGNYGNAIKYIEQYDIKQTSIRIDSIADGIWKNNYAIILFETGQSKKAYQKSVEASILSDTAFLSQSIDKERVLINQALILLGLDSLDQALVIANNARKRIRVKMGKQNILFANSLLIAASIHSAKNNNIKALYFLDRSAEIFKKTYTARHLLYAESLNNIAVLYEKIGYYKPAEYLYETILDTKERKLGKQHISYTKTIFDLAEVKWKRSIDQKTNTDKQKENQKDYLKVIDSLFLIGLSNYQKIIQNEFPLMSDLEKEKFWSSIRPAYNSFFRYAISLHDVKSKIIINLYEQYTTTKGLLLSNASQIRDAILTSTDTTLQHTFKEWKTTKDNLTALYTSTNSKKNNIEQEEEKLSKLEKEINELLTIKEDYSSTSSYNTIQKTLKKKEAILEILRIDEDSLITYVGIIITPEDSLPQLVIINKGNELESRAYNYLKNSIRFRVSDTVPYHNFWKPIEPYLSDYNIIYISSGGVYNQINLNTILLPNGNYLIDEKQFIYITNSKEVATINHDSDLQANGAIELIGAPDFGNKGIFSKLPGAKKEIEQINLLATKNHFKTHKSIGHEACEESVKGIDHPAILHIATHGYFLSDNASGIGKSLGLTLNKAATNPMLQSGLLLCNAENYITKKGTATNKNTDGILTADEAMNLNLQNTSLVVLSACETGLGKVRAGEGVYGLQRALLIAGARDVMMSLWKVNDKATKELMNFFYEELFKSGSKEDAYYVAVKKMRDKYILPYYWGAFVLTRG